MRRLERERHSQSRREQKWKNDEGRRDATCLDQTLSLFKAGWGQKGQSVTVGTFRGGVFLFFAALPAKTAAYANGGSFDKAVAMAHKAGDLAKQIVIR
jgi:hypothetical protein